MQRLKGIDVKDKCSLDDTDLRHGHVGKKYVLKRLQETEDDLPATEPISYKISHLLQYVRSGRSLDSVR